MTKNFRYTILLLFITSVILSSMDWEVPDFFEISDDVNSNTVSLYVQNSISYNFDGKGDLNSSMKSPSIEQYQEDKNLHARSPQFEISKNTTPWHIQAKHVYFDDKGELFELSEDVLIEQAEQAAITTQQLTIDNMKKIAHTDTKVEIKNLQSVTIAKGLHADLEKQYVTLKKVKTVYVPVKKP